jgi:uncharacterized protein YbjT (DUF2867 family)
LVSENLRLQAHPFASPDRLFTDETRAENSSVYRSNFKSQERTMLLVTGASGLSGSAVVREFANQKMPVRALVRNLDKAGAFVDLPTVEVAEGDMAKPDKLTAALEGVDRALMISTADPRMLETQCTFIDACKAAGVGHIVKFSGAEAGFDPMKFRFTRMHEEIEDYLEQSGLAWTHLRPSQFMQVYLRETPTIVNKGALLLPMADGSLAPIDVEDIAKIVVGVMKGSGHEGKSYAMTGPEALTMSEIADCLSIAIGRPVRYVAVSPEDRRDALVRAGVPTYLVEGLYEQALERLRNPKAQVYLETHQKFGVKPTTFAEFAHRNAAGFRGERAAA